MKNNANTRLHSAQDSTQKSPEETFMTFDREGQARKRITVKSFLLGFLLPAMVGSSPAIAFEVNRGQTIFKQLCADCHGANGEGVSGAYDAPLSGDLAQKELTDIIAKTMPEGAPEQCDGADAAAVAQYIFSSFYASSGSDIQPRTSLSRLTGEQLRQSLADLYGHFQSNPWTQNDRGVAASYYEGKNRSKDKLRSERTDAVIDFNFGKEAPVDGVSAEEFCIQWTGSLKVDHSGRYEIILRSTLSCMLDFGADGRTLVNNHVQSEGKDEFRRTLHLTGGRAYPFSLNLIQRKRKTEQPPAIVSLSWIPPSGVEEVIPHRHLIPNRLPATFALQTKLPPDDRSYGYERGTSVNRQWDESTTRAALEFAEIAKSELYPKYRKSHKDIPDENRESLKSFLEETVQTALRGPLSEEMKSRYINDQLLAAEDDGEAIKRSLLISLKSPRFLYPAIDADRSESQRRANRLALVLFDSLPSDPWITNLISANKITNEAATRRAATKMLADYRAQAKIRSFLYQWLDLGDLGEITKDKELYPGFDQDLVQQLKGSFDAMIDENLKQGGNFQELLLADWVMTTPKLRAFYGKSWEANEVSGLQLPHPSENEDPTASTKTSPQPEENPTSETTTATQEEAEKTSENADQTPVVAEQVGEKITFRRSVSDSQEHAGIISHPLMMSQLAYFRASSPIHRGVFLTRHTLGRVLRPPNEAFTPINPELHPNLTTRERVELQTGEANCQVCHRKINSLGFALEAFDAVGRFRKEEKGQSINDDGGYQPRKGEAVNFSGARQLAEYLAKSSDCHESFVETAFEHFVKQPINAYGQGRAKELTDFFRENNYSIEKLVIEIACVAAELEPTP